MIFLVGLILSSCIGFSLTSEASLHPDKIHATDSKKLNAYIQDGLFVGGDRLVDDVVIRDIRRANNPAGFERIVFDLDTTHEKAPYYQVSINPTERRLTVTIWGKPKMGVDLKKVIQSFSKSAAVQQVVFLPQLEEDFITVVFQLKRIQPVETFELSSPSRVIVDLKTK